MSHNAITAHYVSSKGTAITAGRGGMTLARFAELRKLLDESLLANDMLAAKNPDWADSLRFQLDVVALGSKNGKPDEGQTALVMHNVYWLQSRGHLQPDDLNGMQFIEVQL